MKQLKSLLIIATFLIISSPTFAQGNQNSDTLLLRKGGIKSQFEYLINKSTSFTGVNGGKYKSINLKSFNTLKENTIDSLINIRKELIRLENTNEAQLNEIVRLKSSLEKTKSDLKIAKEVKDSVSFFGAQMSKTGYSVIIWMIIVILLSLLLLFIYKFTEGHKITKIAKQNLADLEEEYEEHRKNALEREQKVRRQLIDEINKHKKGK